MALSTTLVSPTSISARPATFPPAITLGGGATRVLVEQIASSIHSASGVRPGGSTPMSFAP
jgi:hypothetical protein